MQQLTFPLSSEQSLIHPTVPVTWGRGRGPAATGCLRSRQRPQSHRSKWIGTEVFGNPSVRGAEAAGSVTSMRLFLVLLVIAVILAGVGFVVHVLWIVALIFLLVFLLGVILGPGRKARN